MPMLRWGSSPADTTQILITNLHLNQNSYEIFKATPGYEDTIILGDWVDGTFVLQPNQVPVANTKLFKVNDNAANNLAYIDSSGILYAQGLIVTGTASISTFPVPGANMPSLVVTGTASINNLETNTATIQTLVTTHLYTNGVTSLGNLNQSGIATMGSIQVFPGGQVNNIPVRLFTQTLNSPQATMGTPSLPGFGAYSAMRITWSGRVDVAQQSLNAAPTLVINDDNNGSGGFYGWGSVAILTTGGGSFTAFNAGNEVCYAILAGSAAPSFVSAGVIDIQQTTASTLFRSYTFSSFTPSAGGGAGFLNGGAFAQGGANWKSISALNSLYLNTISGNFITGSNMTIYGFA